MLVAETTNVELHYRAGPAPSDEIYALFAPHQFKHDGMAFWGDKLADKIGIGCIAFVDKSSTWFPAEDMQVLAGHARQFLEQHGRVISYGASMGGYAALKYGRLLGATHTVAFSPQYSIDPADVPSDTRYRQFHAPALHRDMRVGPGDVAGRAMVVYDPWCRIDADHVQRLKQAGADFLAVPAYLTDHSPIACFAASDRIRELFDLLVADDPARLRRLVRQATKARPDVRARAAVEQTVDTKVARAERLLDRHGHLLPLDQLVRLRGLVARRHLADKQFEAAARNALNGVFHAPNNAMLLELLSDILFGLKRDKAAHIWLQRSIAADGRRHSAHHRLAAYRARIRDFDGAVAAATSAITHSGGHPVMMHGLSEIFTASGDAAMALKWAVAAADKAPANAWLQVRAARLLLQNGDLPHVAHYAGRADRAAGSDRRVTEAAADIMRQHAELAGAAPAVPLFGRSIFLARR